MSLLDAPGDDLAGKRVGLFSYGSGCSSEFFSGVVGERAREVIRKARISEQLAARTRIDFAEYERIMQLPPEAPIDERPAAGTFRFTGFTSSKRTYAAG
jgi:hydroxymethylglutaryl-CoA synthase